MNGIDEIPVSWGNLASLRELDLSNNIIKALPDSFVNLTNLMILKLSSNQIKLLPEHFGNLSSLSELNLYCNPLIFLPDDFGNLSHLRILYLNTSRLQSLPDSFGNLRELEFLDLSQTKIYSLPDSFGALHNLFDLDLSDSNLHTLPDSLGSLGQLTQLQLQNNHISSLPESFVHLASLRFLNLGNNHIQSLPIEMDRLSSLERINLSSNPLSSLPNSIVLLPANCSVELENTHLSLAVLERLGSAIQNRGDLAPRFSFESNFPNIYQDIRNKKNRLEVLRSWLSRLSFMEQKSRVKEQGLSIKILTYLQLAEQSEVFRERFFETIEGAATTCGDRMALSILHIGIARSLQEFDKKDLKGFAHFLIHGPWMVDQLQHIARTKINTLHFVDEIEVYLAYPVKLKEQLGIQIDIEDMLYFACSQVTQEDLSKAAEAIQEMLTGPDTVENILLQREDWIEALRINFPLEMSEYHEKRGKQLEELIETEEYSKSSEMVIQQSYMSHLLALTKRVLS